MSRRHLQDAAECGGRSSSGERIQCRRAEERTRVRTQCHSTCLRAEACRPPRLAVDVVIPTFDRRALLERCLARLETQTIEHTTIVVDNGSTDGTRRMVRERFPRVRLVELHRNMGFPAACNRGVDAGTSDVVVLLNNDVDVPPDFLERLVEPLSDRPGVGSVAAILVRPGGEMIDAVGVTVDPTLAGFPRLRGRTPREAEARSPVLTGPAGAAGAYRRAAWEQVRGLDEGVLGYGEDVDLALRLRGAGWEAALAPAAVAVHLGSASFGRRSALQRYHGGFSRGYFLRRYDVLRTRWSLRTLGTEAAVVVGDALVSRDLSALRGRIAGWRAAAALPHVPTPPPEAVDRTISFRESVRLRRVVYAS